MGEGHVNVVRPMGVLSAPAEHYNLLQHNTVPYKPHAGCFFPNRKEETPEKLKYLIALSFHLRLNLTMQDVQLWAVHRGRDIFSTTCWPDYVKIETYNHRGRSSYSQEYCGFHSQITVYPEHTSVYIGISDIFSAFRIKQMFFSVIEPKRIVSVSSKNQAKVSNCQCTKLRTDKQTPMMHYIFHIRVRAHRRISLLLNAFASDTVCQVFDGPGPKSKLLHPYARSRFPSYTSSKFQAVVQCLHPVLKQMKIKYGHLLNPNHCQEKAVDTKVTFTLPSTMLCTDSTFCILTLKAKATQKVNLTLNGFTYVGERNTEHCRYAGVALFTVKEEDICVQSLLRVTSTEYCYQTNKTQGIIHSVDFVAHSDEYPSHSDHWTSYSENNTLLLVFYYFQEYGNMTVNITATKTFCRIIFFDLCLGALAWDNRVFLQNEFGRQSVLPWSEKCFVITMKHYPMSGKAQKKQECSSHLYSEPNTAQGDAMKITTVGSLAGRSSISAQFCDTKLQHSSSCEGTNAPNKSGVASCVCEGEKVKCESFQQNFDRTAVSFSLRYITPTNLFVHALKLTVVVQKGFGTWVNIIVQITKSDISTYPVDILPFSNLTKMQQFKPQKLGKFSFLHFQVQLFQGFNDTVSVLPLFHFSFIKRKHLLVCTSEECVSMFSSCILSCSCVSGQPLTQCDVCIHLC